MDIKDIRQEIDNTDDQLLQLFMHRMDLSAQVAEFKKHEDRPVVDKTRERKILAKIRAGAGKRERYANSLWNIILSTSRAYQNELMQKPSPVRTLIEAALAEGKKYEVFPQTGSVAVSGVEGGYSQMAADRMFPRGDLKFFATFDAVFEAVDSGQCEFGIVPIENSSNGSVRAVYDLIQRKHVYIVRSEKLFVHHELLAKPGVKLEDIREIRSHEQALGQCSEFIASLGSRVITTKVTNTAEAVKQVMLSDLNDIAAIGSHAAGEIYGLTPVATRIQNSENNYTRFICISKTPCVYPGANRISLVLTCKHQPGALYEVLGKFAALGINLAKLESLPIVGQDFNFMFFFDIDANVCEPGVSEMISDLDLSTDNLSFLGCYLER